MKRSDIVRFLKMRHSIDYWSIPHVLFGAVTALLTVVIAVPAVFGFIATLILAIIWEFFEVQERIKENIRNKTADVLFPLVAFPATYLFVQYVVIEHERRVGLLVTVTIFFLYTNFMAWRARLDHDRDFMN